MKENGLGLDGSTVSSWMKGRCAFKSPTASNASIVKKMSKTVRRLVNQATEVSSCRIPDEVSLLLVSQTVHGNGTDCFPSSFQYGEPDDDFDDDFFEAGMEEEGSPGVSNTSDTWYITFYLNCSLAYYVDFITNYHPSSLPGTGTRYRYGTYNLAEVPCCRPDGLTTVTARPFTTPHPEQKSIASAAQQKNRTQHTTTTSISVPLFGFNGRSRSRGGNSLP